MKEQLASSMEGPTTSPHRSGSGARIAAIGAIWLLIAIGAGASGAVAKLRPPLPQILLIGLTAALLMGFWKTKDFRSWLWALSPRYFLLLHLTRFVGAYLLFLSVRGRLPYAFAVPVGWGDIMVAGTAVIILGLSPGSKVGRRCYVAWNFVGFLDILFVVVTAARLSLSQPHSMDALLALPLSLLPTFLVPIIIASHVILFCKLSRGPEGNGN